VKLWYHGLRARLFGESIAGNHKQGAESACGRSMDRKVCHAVLKLCTTFGLHGQQQDHFNDSFPERSNLTQFDKLNNSGYESKRIKRSNHFSCQDVPDVRPPADGRPFSCRYRRGAKALPSLAEGSARAWRCIPLRLDFRSQEMSVSRRTGSLHFLQWPLKRVPAP
jgi:hypothetical protein